MRATDPHERPTLEAATTQRTDRLNVYVPAALGVLAAVAPVTIALVSRFNGLYGQDPYGYYDYAIGPLRDSLTSGHIPPPTFWPLGYGVLVATVSLVTGRTPFAGQIVSLIAAVLVPPLTAGVARRIVPADGGLKYAPLWAALIAACVGQLWSSGIVVMADTTALAAAALSAYALVRVWSTRSRLIHHWLYLSASAMALAWATSTRWQYLVLFPVWIAFLLLRPDHHTPEKHTPRARQIRAAALFAVAYGLALSPQLWMAARFTSDTAAPYQAYGWSPRNFLAREVNTPDGRQLRTLANGVFYASLPARLSYLTPIVAPFALVGFWRLARDRHVTACVLTAGWPLATYVLIAGAPVQNGRFMLATVPPIAILAGIGVAWSLEPGRRWHVATRLVAAGGIGLMLAGGVRMCRALVTQKQADVSTVRWVEARTAADAIVVAFSITLTLQHVGARDTRELFFQTPEDLDALLRQARPVFVLVDVDTMKAQWHERSPGQNFRWLEQHARLAPLGRHRTFTLFSATRR